MHNKKLHMVTFLLLVVGGLNWGLEGLFNWGIADILGDGISRIIYILVGLSAIYELATHKHTCKPCTTKSAPAPQASEGGDQQ